MMLGGRVKSGTFPEKPQVSEDLHENLHYIGDVAFLGYQIKMSLIELNYCSSAVLLFFS